MQFTPASGKDMLFLEAENNVVKIHPVVLFSILDHYIRRVEGQQRVIGTLLGTVLAHNVVEVKGCFPVPHMEKDEEVAVGKDFNKQMLALQKRADRTGDKVVGWYATTADGVPITEQSCLIHEFYGTECTKPVHLVLDTCLNQLAIGIKAFVSTPLSVASRALATQFKQIPVEMATSESEKIAVDAMLNGQKGKWETSNGVSGLDSGTQNLERSMRRLLEMLEMTSEYVENVKAGKEPANSDIGREIASTLAAIPRIRPEVFDQVFNSSLQDLLMVVYLSNLTRAQLAIAQKLNQNLS